MVHRAAKTALAPPTGPVFLSLPGDILNAEADIDLGAPTRVAPRHPRRPRRDRGGGDAPRRGRAPAHHRRRRRGAEPRASPSSSSWRSCIGAPVYPECIANTASFPVLASAVPRRAWRGSQPAIRAILDRARRAVLGRRRSLHPVAAVRRRCRCRRADDRPSRHRSVGARQELSGRGRDPRQTRRRRCPS